MKKNDALRWLSEKLKSTYLKLFLNIALGVVSALLGVRLALASRNVIDVALGQKTGSFLGESTILFGIVALQLIISVINSNLHIRISGGLTVSLKQSIFKGLMKKDWQKVSAHHSGELLNRINSDIQVVVSGVSNVLPNFFSMAAKFLSAFWAMFLLDKTFAFIAILVGPLVVIAALFYGKKMKSYHKKVQQADGKASAFMQESLQNLLMIKSFSSEDFITEKSSFLQKIAYKLKIKRNTISIFANSALYLAFSAGYYVALAWGAYRLANGIITVGSLTAFLQLINQVQTPFVGLSSVIPQFFAMVASAERIIEIEQLPDEETVCAQGISGEFEKISFDGVSFAYDNKPVIKDAHFEIEKNEFVTILGESGAGKSTLIKLLLGIVSPNNGDICIDVGGTTHFASKQTRKLFAYVPQGSMILSGTIRENIKFSNESATDEQIKEGAKLAEIWDFIEASEAGLDTVLGERGAGLSEGQIQRLAIARALIYDTPVLLLDEATSALDEATELAVLKNLRNLPGKTCIMISHKKAALDFCDKQFQISDGKIVYINNKNGIEKSNNI